MHPNPRARSYCKGWFCITHGRGCPMSSWSRYVFQKDPAHSCSPSWLGPVMSCHCRLSCTQWITIVQEYPNLRILSESGADFSLCNEECASLSQLLVQPIRSTERPTDSSLQRRWRLFCAFLIFSASSSLVCLPMFAIWFAIVPTRKKNSEDLTSSSVWKKQSLGSVQVICSDPNSVPTKLKCFRDHPGSETDQCIAPTSHGPSLEWSAVLN